MTTQRNIYVTDNLTAGLDAMACDEIRTAWRIGALQQAMHKYAKTPDETKAFLQGARVGIVFLLGSIRAGKLDLSFTEIDHQAEEQP